ncbi:MAG TPA: gephyrin-like molybdotransferase Glp [Mycobacteriales bacterium]|nr:gephyrin-like molybdotransferase Glp [Mycobacteriales bacterium]
MTAPGGGSGGGAERPLRVEQHLDRILATVRRPAPMEVALLDAHGLHCAEQVVARWPLPGFDNSAMDGYAVRSADVAGADPDHPVVLPVVGDIAAGASAPEAIGAGLTVRIMTGAPMPVGADAVVPVEWTDRGVVKVAIHRPAPPDTYVRHVGEDIRAGDVAVESGTLVGPAQAAVLAAIGRERVLVHPRPRAVVLSTGSELVEVGQRPGPGELVDSNGYLLAMAARDAGAEVYRAGIVPDDRRRLLDTLEGQLTRADLLITSGGVSMGAYDVVKEALAELGTVQFHRVAMQPGMPQGFGTLGPEPTPVFCLPGNPVSALVSFEAFVRPAIRYMLGSGELHRAAVSAVLSEPLTSPLGRRQYRRGRLRTGGDGGPAVAPVGGPGSHLLASLARADCLIVIEEEVTELSAGSRVTVVPLSSPGA